MNFTTQYFNLFWFGGFGGWWLDFEDSVGFGQVWGIWWGVWGGWGFGCIWGGASKLEIEFDL